MSKRNLTLLIIGLVIIGIIAFVFFSSYNSSSQSGNTGTNTNFFSNLLSFGRKNTGTDTSPANISGFTQNTNNENSTPQNLVKVSSMPVAGFGVFMKERFVNLPVVTPENTTSPNLPLSGEATSTTVSGVTTSPPDKGDLGGSKTAKILKPTPPPTEFIPSLRYVAKATGNIYETFADTIDETQFTTTTIPQVYDAYFSNNCTDVAMRYLNDDGKTIETFVGTLPSEVLGEDTLSSTELKGSFLPENVTNINVSPDTKNIFYLFNLSSTDSSVGITAGGAGDKKIQIFSSPFTEWTSWWPNNRMITLTTKPSVGVPGYMYAVDPNKKDLNKILSGVNGLTTLTSPSGKLVLYSNDNLNLSIYNTDTKQSTSTGLKTLPEKCVWNKLSNAVYCAVPKFIDQTNYPDIWYQGQVSFSDDLWKIDVLDGTTSLISDPSVVGADIDGIKLAIDDNENYLFFINKKDSYLWELSL